MSELKAINDELSRPGCEPARSALQRLLDGEAAWDTAEADAHRAGCPDCREELALARRFGAVAAAVVVPAGLAGQILRAAAVADRRRRFYRYAGLGTALAASVTFAVVLLQPAPQTVSESHSVALRPRPPEGAPLKPLGESVSEAREAIVALTRRAADETRDTSVTLLPNPKLGYAPDAGAGLEPLADARASAARSVEPLRTSARRALNLFMRAADPANKATVQ